MGTHAPPVWSLDGITMNTDGVRDADGIQWILTPDSDPRSAAAPTTQYSPKFQRPGSYWIPGQVEKGGGTLVIRGYARHDDWAAAERAFRKALALCQDTSRLYPLVYQTPTGGLVTYVARDGDILPKWIDNQDPGFEISMQFASPDPRWYETEWQIITTGVPQNSVTGLDFGPGNLTINPLFEVDASGWSAVNAATVGVGAGGAMGTVNAGKATSTQNTTPSGLVSTAMITGLTAGATYRASCFFNPSTSGTAQLAIDWYNASNTLISSTTLTTATLSAATWSDQQTLDGVAPALTTQAKIRVQKGPIAVGAFLLADDIEFRAVASGLDFDAGPGLDFGIVGATGTILLDNTRGTAPSSPLLTLTGPLTTPVLSVAGGSIKYNDTLTAGQFVDLNPEDPSVLLNGTSGRGYLANPAQWDSFIVQPGSSLSIGLSHSGPSTDLGTVTARFRPANW